MGMFDSFKPNRKYSCPVCNEMLDEWQGKDLDCLLFEWSEGHKYPTGTSASPDSIGEGYFKSTIDVSEFLIYSFDCNCPYPIQLKCETKDNVWVKTSMFTGSKLDRKFFGSETKVEYKNRMRWLEVGL